MFALIVGCSEIGYHLTKALMAAGHEVLVVEKDRDRYRLLTEELGGVALHGDGTDEQILREAGAARAEVFFALTGRDETNLVACQLTKHVFNTPRTLALIRDPKNESVFHFLGVDVVVNSVQLLLAYLEEGIPGRPMVHLRDLPEPGTALVSVSIPGDSAIVGRRLGDLELPPHSLICLVIKRGGPQLPSNTLVVEAEDELVAVAMTEDQQLLYDILTGV